MATTPSLRPPQGTLSPEALRGHRLATIAITLGANLFGALLIFVFLTFLAPPDSSTPALEDDRLRSLAVFGLYLLFALPLGYAKGVRSFLPVLRWLEDAPRPPTPDERTAALHQPARLAQVSLAMWFGAAVAFGGLNFALDATGFQTLRSSIGIILGGLASSAVIFLLLEWRLRPLVALALAGQEAERPTSLGLRPRIILSWALGSGVPLLALLLAPLGRDGLQSRGLAAPVLFLAVTGLGTGFVFALLTARSVAQPLDEVRATLREVQEGRLDVSLPVDDPGEIGALQSGVNKMVDGLRERERLSDLFGRHVGTEVARAALANEISLGGEQRSVSALFVDLIGSTGLAATRPATEVVATLNALFDAVVRTVGEEGGWVNKFEGDGALCVFGAPGEQPDHAARALRAARGLRFRLVEGAADHPGLDAAIGVSSGIAVAGNVGALERYEYTVIGDPVNEASRLSELAKERPGRVVASGRAIGAAGTCGDEDEAAHWVRGATVTLRGRPSPTDTWEPIGS